MNQPLTVENVKSTIIRVEKRLKEERDKELEIIRKRLVDLDHKISQYTLKHGKESYFPRMLAKFQKEKQRLNDGVEKLIQSGKDYDQKIEEKISEAIETAISSSSKEGDKDGGGSSNLVQMIFDNPQTKCGLDSYQYYSSNNCITAANEDLCENCHQPMKLSIDNSFMTCPICRHGRAFVDSTSAITCYGDEVEFTSFTYEKIHHFDDWLKKSQGKSNKKIEKWVLMATTSCLHDVLGIKTKEDVSIVKVHEALKCLGLNSYYDHCVQIFCLIKGIEPPTMNPEQEEMCRLLFRAIQAPYKKWYKVIDPTRKNFHSYSYCLFKFCQLLGYTEFLPFFKLLKGQNKIKVQDAIFKKECEELNWEFIPS